MGFWRRVYKTFRVEEIKHEVNQGKMEAQYIIIHLKN